MHTEALGHRCVYIEDLLHRKAFTHGMRLYREAFPHRKLLDTASFYTKTLVRTKWQQSAQSTSLYYFELQDLRKFLPSTTLYYEPCTKYCNYYFVVQTVAQSTSQYYFVLQSLRVVFPVLLCTTRLAQRNLQSYFVLQSLHKAISSTTLYYKTGQNTSQYYFKYTNEVPFIVH